MEDASLGDQQGETLHGIRDITNSAEGHWSELARAHQDELKGRKRYRCKKRFLTKKTLASSCSCNNMQLKESGFL